MTKVEKSEKDVKQELMSNFSDQSDDFDQPDYIREISSIDSASSPESVLNPLNSENSEDFASTNIDNIDSFDITDKLVNTEDNGKIGNNDNTTYMTDNSSPNDTAHEIQKQFSENNIDISYDEIKERYDDLINTFKVTESEARRCVINYYSKKNNLDRNLFYNTGSVQLKKVEEINSLAASKDSDESGKPVKTLWANVALKIIRIWDNPHDKISQSGIAGDETGTIRFTIWKNSELPEVSENKSYCFKNVVLREWNGRYNIELNRASSIEETDKQIVVKSDDLQKLNFSGERQNAQVLLSEVSNDNWYDLKAKVIKIWDNTHESIKQNGIIGDESGIIKFTIWNTSDVSELKENESYLIKNTIVKEWNGRFTAEIKKSTSVEKIDEDIEVNFEKVTITGASVDIQSGSGLIKRCPDCNRVISRGFCNEHGKVKGVYDLRIKAVIDDGKETQDVIINRELTEKISNTTLAEAVEYVSETLDTEAFVDNLKLEFIGRYYKIIGSKTERYIIADSVELENTDKSKEKEALVSLIKGDLFSSSDVEVI